MQRKYTAFGTPAHSNSSSVEPNCAATDFFLMIFQMVLNRIILHWFLHFLLWILWLRLQQLSLSQISPRHSTLTSLSEAWQKWKSRYFVWIYILKPWTFTHILKLYVLSGMMAICQVWWDYNLSHLSKGHCICYRLWLINLYFPPLFYFTLQSSLCSSGCTSEEIITTYTIKEDWLTILHDTKRLRWLCAENW